MNDIIVSMTCIPERCTYLYNVLKSLINQKIQPTKILVYYQGDLSDLTYNIKTLSNIIDIIKIDDKYRSYNKFIYTIEKYNNDIIILCDDDIEYNDNYINNLITGYNKKNDDLICNCFNYIQIDNDCVICNPKKPDTCEIESNYIKPLSGWGTLIPPNFYNKENLDNLDTFFSKNPTDDEMWLYINCLYNKKHIYCHGLYKNPFWKTICIKSKKFNYCLYNINKEKEYIYGRYTYQFMKDYNII